jgi:2-methylcitrate dehydratase PrpD
MQATALRAAAKVTDAKGHRAHRRSDVRSTHWTEGAQEGRSVALADANAMVAIEELSRRNFLSKSAGSVAGPLVLASLPRRASAFVSDGAASPRPLARRLADYLSSVRYEQLDPRAIDRAKEHLIYHVGLAFSGALTDHGRQALRLSRELSHGRGQSTVIGDKLLAPSLDAAFANSTFMRAQGFDDVLFPSATHAGLLTYPAALAVGEEFQASGREFLTAVVTAYEILGKLARDDGPGRAPRRPSMPFGPFAGVTAAARLMRLTAEQAAHAIGYAADGAMGLKEGNEQQPTHIYGLINRTAITAAKLARAGGQTAGTILEGKYGYFATLIGVAPDPDAIVSSLGKDPEILRATQKRYPGTAMNIVPIQLFLDLTRKHRLDAANVERVEYELPDDRRTFEDSISKGPFPTYTQAASSLPFQTAIILLDGDVTPARFEQRDAPEVLAAVQKVSIRLVARVNTRFAAVKVQTVDGRTFQAKGDKYEFPPIDAAAWLSKDGTKFVSMDKLTRFAALVRKLEHVRDIRAVTDCLRP